MDEMDKQSEKGEEQDNVSLEAYKNREIGHQRRVMAYFMQVCKRSQ